MSVLTNTYLKNDSALKFYLPLNENTGSSVADGSGNGNTGTWNGTLGSQWTPGVFGFSAGNFNGSDNFVDCGSPSNLGLSGNQPFTLCAWIKMTGLNLDGAVVAYGGAANGRVIAIDQNSDYSMRSIHFGSDHVYTAKYDQGIWTHCAIVYDGTTEKLYKNGLDTGESWSPTALVLQASDALRVGSASWNTTRVGACAIAEVALFNRALISQEIALLGSPAEVGTYNLARNVRVGNGMSRSESAT